MRPGRRPRAGGRALDRRLAGAVGGERDRPGRADPRGATGTAGRAGTVVFVNSGAGLSASPQWAAYAASKHGLRALADALRGEERGNGIRVTTVYPGRTATPMQRKVHQLEGRPYDADDWIDPATVAGAILGVLDLAPDATVSDLTIQPR